MSLKETIKELVPRSIIRSLKKKPVKLTAADVEGAGKNIENKELLPLLKNVNLSRSLYDDMYHNNGPYYLQVGLSAVEYINAALNRSKIRVTDIKQILDMPCGHARVMRFLSQRFPEAAITACDTNKDGVDFCKNEFGAAPVYSKHDLKTFNIGKKFDLIWCGSLATHFDANNTTELIKFLYRHLNNGGLLVFSMHGKLTLDYLSTRKDTYALDDAGIEKVLSETKETGYGYADYPGDKGYGISAATPEWMERCMNSTGKWREYNLSETAWVNHHDIYSAVKV